MTRIEALENAVKVAIERMGDLKYFSDMLKDNDPGLIHGEDCPKGYDLDEHEDEKDYVSTAKCECGVDDWIDALKKLEVAK